MNKSISRKEPDWVALSAKWERSGVSQKRFCKKHGLSYGRFCAQRKKLLDREREAGRLEPIRPRKLAQFIPVTVEADEPALTVRPDANRRIPEVEVELLFGVILRFRGMSN